MAVVIRLQRTGKPKQAYYRVVAIEKSRGAAGQPLEILGSYDPRQETAGKKVQIKKDRFEHWVKNGALPSQTVASLVKAGGKAAAGA
ncbi:MAG: 30S ribosomal protein S16 [Elusimicrobia bacterium]|nr:30S ribosomal protein S16 [Elusimicrobiota bacterium]MDE2237436.1 30S ribosomal protein S16 [Elusimicrobiota bacterium]MDE2426372.1 30S ribosomal protein S16 [Elusimicrobiota bacterium]